MRSTRLSKRRLGEADNGGINEAEGSESPHQSTATEDDPATNTATTNSDDNEIAAMKSENRTSLTTGSSSNAQTDITKTESTPARIAALAALVPGGVPVAQDSKQQIRPSKPENRAAALAQQMSRMKQEAENTQVQQQQAQQAPEQGTGTIQLQSRLNTVFPASALNMKAIPSPTPGGIATAGRNGSKGNWATLFHGLANQLHQQQPPQAQLAQQPHMPIAAHYIPQPYPLQGLHAIAQAQAHAQQVQAQALQAHLQAQAQPHFLHQPTLGLPFPHQQRLAHMPMPSATEEPMLPGEVQHTPSRRSRGSSESTRRSTGGGQGGTRGKQHQPSNSPARPENGLSEAYYNAPDHVLIDRILWILRRDKIHQKNLAWTVGLSSSTLCTILRGRYPHTKETHLTPLREWAFERDKQFTILLLKLAVTHGLTDEMLAQRLEVPQADLARWIDFTLPLLERTIIDQKALPWISFCADQLALFPPEALGQDPASRAELAALLQQRSTHSGSSRSPSTARAHTASAAGTGSGSETGGTSSASAPANGAAPAASPRVSGNTSSTGSPTSPSMPAPALTATSPPLDVPASGPSTGGSNAPSPASLVGDAAASSSGDQNAAMGSLDLASNSAQPRASPQTQLTPDLEHMTPAEIAAELQARYEAQVAQIQAHYQAQFQQLQLQMQAQLQSILQSLAVNSIALTNVATDPNGGALINGTSVLANSTDGVNPEMHLQSRDALMNVAAAATAGSALGLGRMRERPSSLTTPDGRGNSVSNLLELVKRTQRFPNQNQ